MPSAAPTAVLVTVNSDSPLWPLARADVGAAYLPYVCREIVAGNVSEAIVPVGELAKLQTFIRSLPSGKESLPFAVADPPEPERPEVTGRTLVARKIADVVRALGAVSPYGGEVTREESGRYYAVAFGMGRLVTGCVFVYSPGYVRIGYTANTGDSPPNGLPSVDNRIFESGEDAARFLYLALSKKSYSEALVIPLRQPKRKSKPE